MAVLRTYIGVLMLSVFLCVAVQAAGAGSGKGYLSRNAAAAHSHNGAVRGSIFRRFNRQTPSEDSYEDVVEYEYEEEAGPTDATTGDTGKAETTGSDTGSKKKEEAEPEPTEEEVEGGKKPDATNNEDGDEYYDAYDETPGENGGNNGGDEEEGAKAEDDEEETGARERGRNRPRTDDDDADEDSAEREDRLEEERRQAEIREQERLEEERREEERREYQRRQEAAEEEEEEDTEEDWRHRQEEERTRAEAETDVNPSEEEPEEKERPEERRRSDEVPDREHDRDERVRENEERQEEYEIDPRRVWFVSTVMPTAVTTPVTTPQPQPEPEAEHEPEEVEYEEEDVEEAVPEPQPEATQQPAPLPREFEEERRHQHTDEEDEGRDRDREDSDREEFVESDLNGEYGPTESSAMRPTTTQAPIPIEESGREDLERYTYGRRPEPAEPEERHEEEEEEVAEEDYDYRGRHETTPQPTNRPNYAPEYEVGEHETPEESGEEEQEMEGMHSTQPPPRAEMENEEEMRVRFVPVSVSTTEQTWPHYPHVHVPTTQRARVEDEYAHHRHPVPYDNGRENEIDESIDEDVDEHELRTTTTEPPTQESVEEDREREREDDRINQIHKETTDEHHEPRLREEDDDDDGLGFYEGRRFNEESRQRQDEDEEEEMNGIVDHDVTHRRPVVVANLDLSREPDEDDHEADIDDVVIEQSITSTTTSTSTTTPRPAVRYPDRFNNRIDDGDSDRDRDSDEDERVNSFYDINHNYNGHGHGRTRPTHTHRPGPEYEDSDRRTDNTVVVDYNVNRFGETPTRIECFSGYHLSQDGTECLDVDECSQNVCGSTQICLNTPGSYRCTCNQGFVKDFRNEFLCRDINECEIGNGGCGHDCVNTHGSYYCSCSEGYDLARDGRNCNLRPTTPTTTTTSTTTTTTTTPPPAQTTRPSHGDTTPKPTTPLSVITHDGTRISNCPTPPVPRGSGIAYLYCSRSPVGIHHRHSQLERRLLQDWAARRSRYNTSERVNSRFRLRRTLKRRRHPRQTTYSPGSMCELRCRSGFELKGQYTLHCNATSGLWQGTTTGFCQAIPKADNRNIGVSVSSSEATPNEIPRLHPGPEITVPERDREANNNDNGRPFKPSFRPSSAEIPAAGIGGATSFRPNFYQLPVTTTTTSRGPVVFTPPPPATWLTPNHIWSEGKHKPPTPPSTTTTTTTTGRPYYHYYSPVTPFRPLIIASTTTTSTTTPAPTTRNSFIHLTYRFKTPWIRCPDDIKIDLQPGQRLAYVIIPQPQTNVDWWRQVTSEPSWAKGLETEIGPGKQKIVFRARTPAPLNNSAECSFVLEVRDIEPPTIRDCPESFSVRLSPGQSARAVTWVEPHFSDNVRVQTIKKSREPGLIMTAGEHVVNYEVSDSSNNRAKCTFTVQVVASPVSDSRFSHQNNLYRRPAGTEAITTTTLNPIKTDIHSTIKNVVCHVGKKGRRIVFQSRVVPRGCSEMPLDLAGDSSGMLQNGAGQYNTMNTLVQNSAENSATSQISSVSFSSNDHPQSASAFGQAVSNGRHSNRLVHSTSVVTNGAQGTSSRASSYALSSSRNFDTPLLITADKQVYDEDFVVPSSVGPRTRVSNGWGGRVDEEHEPRDFVRSGGYGRERYLNPEIRSATPSQPSSRNTSSNGRNHQEPNQQDQTPEYRKYFRHFDSWDSAGNRL